MVSLFVISYSLISLCFPTFSIVFPNTKFFINLKKPFSLCPMSMYGFNYASWLKSITLCDFSSISPWLSTRFRVLYVLYFFCHVDYIQVFGIYQYPFFLVRMVRSMSAFCNSLRHSTLTLYPVCTLCHCFHHSFVWSLPQN